MKNRLTKYLILLFYCSALTVNAQQKISIFSINKKDCDLSCSVRGFFLKNYAQITGCGSGICFIKFNISPQGDIVNINFNEGTPSFLQQFLKEALDSTKLEWGPGKNKKDSLREKTFFLPISYRLKKCKDSRDTTLFINNDIYTARPIPSLKDALDKKNEYSFLHMLDFENITDDHVKSTLNPVYPPLDCTILPVVVLTVPFIESGFPSKSK